MSCLFKNGQEQERLPDRGCYNPVKNPYKKYMLSLQKNKNREDYGR